METNENNLNELKENEINEAISKLRAEGNHESAFKLELFNFIENRNVFCESCLPSSYHLICFECLSLEVNKSFIKYLGKNKNESK